MQNSSNVSTFSHAADRELKAYIYQQLVDIQPYLLADSQLAVAVEQVKAKGRSGKKEYIVTLSATVEEGRMETEGQNADVYEAFGKAKELMVQQLTELQNSQMDAAEREVEVQTALSGAYKVH